MLDRSPEGCAVCCADKGSQMQSDAIKEMDTSSFWRECWSSVKAEERDVWFYLDERKFRYLLPFLPAVGKTLEVGCGSARLSRFLAAARFQVAGVDYEMGALRYAREAFVGSGLDGDLVRADVNRLPFRTGSFDAVLSTGLLEHFLDPYPIVLEMVRVLRPGGVFYSDIVPKKFSLLRSLDFLRLRRTHMFERPLSKSQIVSLLARAQLIDARVFAAGIFLPRLPLVERWRLSKQFQNRLAALVSRVNHHLDDTRIAELLGVYYFACARKASASLSEGVTRWNSDWPDQCVTGGTA